jgi:hypothetical protein
MYHIITEQEVTYRLICVDKQHFMLLVSPIDKLVTLQQTLLFSGHI